MNKTLKFYAIFLLILISLSCSQSEPKIDFGFLQLIYYPGEAAGVDFTERYSLFILPYDDDGVENLGELYLFHDKEGLCWEFHEDDWVAVDEDNRTWIGSHNITMINYETLPRGLFRIVLVNKAGEKTERTITFDGPAVPRFEYPSFTAADGRYLIDSEYPVNRFIGFNQQGERIQTVRINEITGTFRDLRVSSNVHSVALWAEDEDGRVSALTEAISIR